jgi:Fic family protein
LFNSLLDNHEDYNFVINPDQKESFGYKNADTFSAIFSSNIEGNSLDINTYFNLKDLKNQSPNYIKEAGEIDSLKNAYEFAKCNPLTEVNLKKAHNISTKTFLDKFLQGSYKTGPNGVFNKNGLVYMACPPPEQTNQEMSNLFRLIQKSKPTSFNQALFYSALIHLIFVHIHPFVDGNGRIARLLQKWYLLENGFEDAFYIQFEACFKDNRQLYYSSINLGVNYMELNYTKAGEFFRLVLEAVENKNDNKN